MSYWLNSAGDLNLDSTLHNLGVSSLSQHGVSGERMIWGEMSQCDHNIGIIRRPQREGGTLLSWHDNHHRGAPPLFPMITTKSQKNSWETISKYFFHGKLGIGIKKYLQFDPSCLQEFFRQFWSRLDKKCDIIQTGLQGDKLNRPFCRSIPNFTCRRFKIELSAHFKIPSWERVKATLKVP